MWAILDKDEKTVIGCIPPDKTYEEALQESQGYTLIPVTLENSPGYLPGTYENGKFLPPEEIKDRLKNG
jgi:hypothetical protein